MKAPKTIMLNFKRIRATMQGWKRERKPASYNFESFMTEWRTNNARRIRRTS